MKNVKITFLVLYLFYLGIANAKECSCGSFETGQYDYSVVDNSGGSNEQKEADVNNIVEGQKLSAQAKISTGGKVPGNNPISLALKKTKITFKEANAIYLDAVPKSAGEDYYTNLKHLGFKLVIDSGLTTEGTKEQKLFYLQEQMNLKKNLPGINNFYALLSSCKDFMSKEEIIRYDTQFFEKNYSAIQNLSVGDSITKHNKRITLVNQKKNFEKYINMKM